MSYFLASSSGVTDEGSEKPDSFDGENLATSDIDMAQGNLNSTQINILSLAPSSAANPAPSEQESSESSSTLEKKVNHEEWHDKLSQSIISLMATQVQNYKEIFKKLFGKKSSVESGDDVQIVIKVRDSGELFFIEIDLERSDLSLKKLPQIIQKEFELSEDISFL